MRRLLWYLAIFVLLLGIVFAKKNDRNTNQDDTLADNTGDVNGNAHTSETYPEEPATRKLKGQRGHKRITVVNNDGLLTTLELSSEKGSSQSELTSQEQPVDRHLEKASETTESSSLTSEPIITNNEHVQRKNKTKIKQRDGLSDQQQPVTGDKLESTSDVAVEPTQIRPLSVARDRSVGIPDHFESEFPQNPQNNFDGAAAAARNSRRRNKATPIPNEVFPVEKHDEVVVITHVVTPKLRKRITTPKPDDEDDYKPEDFHILTGIPPEDLDFRNPSTKATISTSTRSTTEATTTTTSTSTTSTSTTTTTTVKPKRSTTTSTQDEEDNPGGFHILTGIPDDVKEETVDKRTSKHPKRPTLPVPVEAETPADFHILTGIPDDEKEGFGVKKSATHKPARHENEERAETPEDFHILTGIPDDFKEETVAAKVVSTKKPNRHPTTVSGDDEDEEETQKFYILTGIPKDFAGGAGVQRNVEEEHTEPLSRTKKLTTEKTETTEEETTVPTTSSTTTSSTTTTISTTLPVTSPSNIPAVHATKSRKSHKQRTREKLENSKLVATDAEFGKAVNSKFNSIVRNLSASGVLTEKDLLSERVIKNISDMFAERIQQSLLSRDSSEPLSTLERELILDENAEKVIAQFKANRSPKLHMEKRHGSVVDLETLEPSTIGVNAKLEEDHSEANEGDLTETTSSPLITKSQIGSKHKNNSRVNLFPIESSNIQHPLKDGQLEKDSSTTNLEDDVTESARVSSPVHGIPDDSTAEEEDITPSAKLDTTLSVKHTGSGKTKVAGISESQVKETTNNDHSLLQFETSTVSDHSEPLILSHGDGNTEITVVTHRLQSQQYETSTDVEPSTKSKAKGPIRIPLHKEVTEETSESSDAFESSTTFNPIKQFEHELASAKPDLFPKKHQTPLVHFQVGAEGVTLHPAGNVPELSGFGLSNNTNEPEEEDSTITEGQHEPTAVTAEEVKTHFVTRGPLKIPFKGRAEPTELSEETTTTNETSTETSDGFPDPPNWSLTSGKENESFFAGYRTKPVPEVENGETIEKNVSESTSGIHETSPHTLLNATTTANTAAGLLFILSEHGNVSETTTLSSKSGSTKESSKSDSTKEFDDDFEDVTETLRATNTSSTVNFGITYKIDIIETTLNSTSSSANGTSTHAPLNETSTILPSSNSILLLVGGTVNNTTVSSLVNTSVGHFETSSHISSEVTLKETTNSNVSFVTVLGGSNVSLETSTVASHPWTISETTSNITQLVLIPSGSIEVSNSPRFENTSTVSSVTHLSSEFSPGESSLVTINVNKSSAIPEPEWSKSTEYPTNITSEKTPGVPEPEWSKSTIKNIESSSENVSESGSESSKATDKGLLVTVTELGVSGSASEITSGPRPANPAVVTWTFKYSDLDWDSSLNDKASWQYKQLSNKVEPELTKIFKQLLKEKFVGLIIKRFSSGSVIVNGQTEITEKVDTSQLEDSFRTYLRGQNFAISGDTIDPASIRIEGLGDTAPQLAATPSVVSASSSGGGVPGYVIGIIVAVIILVLVVVAIGLYLRRYRNRQSRDDNYMPNHENGNGSKTWQTPPQPQQRAVPANGRDQYAGVNMYEMKDVPHGQVNQGYQGDGRTNGFSGSARAAYPHPSSNL